ncbi:hypothetical protein [Mesorhizobium sp. M0833]
MSTSTRIGIGAGWLGGAIAGSMLDAGGGRGLTVVEARAGSR